MVLFEDGQLSRSALGRVAFIGELYDIRTESFSSRSLLKSSSPSSLIESQDIGQTDFDYSFSETFSDRSDLLKVESELQLSVLLGLIQVDGSACFLNEEKKSEKSVSCSLICNINTVCQKFFASFSEILQHIDLNALEDGKNTHMVAEVNWGAKCLLSLLADCKATSNRQNIEGKLKAEMTRLKTFLSAKGRGNLEMKNLTSKDLQDIKIKVCADVVPEVNWPTSIESFCQFVQDIPKLLANVNKGKGKPMNYAMIPLNTFRKLAKLEIAVDVIVKTIDESFLASTIFFFEEITLLKRKLHDVIREFTGMEKYVRKDDLKEVRQRQTTLALQESELKKLISEDWVRVKSGEKTLKDLIRQVEKFKSRDLNLNSYEEFLDSTCAILRKLQQVKDFISLGVSYLGVGDSFDALLPQDLLSEFLVLLVSSKTKEEDSELDWATTHFFLTEASNPKPNTRYVVIDFDFQDEQSFMNVKIVTAKCFHLKGNRILSLDKYAEFSAELLSNFVRLRKGEAEYIKHKPAKRVPLEMACPSSKTGTCSQDLLMWSCFRCRAAVEYGFDNFFYCSCGKSHFSDFEYRCCHPSHGALFVQGEANFVQKALSFLQPFKEMNILILGQSGVGKSTWINAIVNYLNFESLEAAVASGVICTIPINLTIFDSKTLQEHIIKLGEENGNEVTATGRSATQFPHTYSFFWENKCVRIIDTPGLGDTNGIEQDKINLKNIMHHIGHLKELHGVCILLRANDSRIHAIFSYCLKELLSHLHKSVTKNIVFCFTNARNSFYTPGQTSSLLQNLISKLGIEEDLPLGHHNMFCLDNEAFIFLCSLSNPEISHDEILLKSFGQSWEISLNETRRLFQTISTFEPHKLTETISLVTARYRIMSLSKPIAEISKTIQINIATIERKKEELKATNQTLEELSKKLNFTEIYLESVPLNYPRTVCTSPSCVEYLKFKNTDVQEIDYKTHCHTRCYLDNVEALTVNNGSLRLCEAMSNSGSCKHCGCGWEKHMHITYSQRRVEHQVINKSVEECIQKGELEKIEIESIVRELEDKIAKFKEEQEFIVQASVKFGMFLRRNAITVYNDSVAEYLQYLIEEEENKPHKSKTEKNLLQRMKDMLTHYHAEVKILQEVLQKGESNNEELTLVEMLKIEEKLYKLELTGDFIRKYVECGRASNNKVVQYAETPLKMSRGPKLLNPNEKAKKFSIRGYMLNKAKQVKDILPYKF